MLYKIYGLPLLPLICVILLVFPLFYRSIKAYISALFEKEPILQSCELTQLPKAVFSQIMFRKGQLEALGYRYLGCCTGKMRGNLCVYCAVWLDGAVIAECVINYLPRTKFVTSLDAIGQEFMDETSIVIVNIQDESEMSGKDKLFLPGVKDITILHKVSGAFLHAHRDGRTPWVPADVIEYKKRDFINANPTRTDTLVRIVWRCTERGSHSIEHLYHAIREWLGSLHKVR
jgi:hypothetical protein